MPTVKVTVFLENECDMYQYGVLIQYSLTDAVVVLTIEVSQLAVIPLYQQEHSYTHRDLLVFTKKLFVRFQVFSDLIVTYIFLEEIIPSQLCSTDQTLPFFKHNMILFIMILSTMENQCISLY